eukprot:TRINITY_DN2175_c1_g1_i1.p1 TRINITY_DN2175_c1_g1~~TRINITY_DN2175_c1_g1_i1.p1  ORF type:complete len:293 (+),score=65.37 TRINITY_DN2175_c1_g1_i1:60-938(+)
MATLSCPICFEDYECEGDRRPYTLSCGHSFCKADLDDLRNGEELINCPVCRVTSETKMVPNYALMEVIGSVEGGSQKGDAARIETEVAARVENEVATMIEQNVSAMVELEVAARVEREVAVRVEQEVAARVAQDVDAVVAAPTVLLPAEVSHQEARNGGLPLPPSSILVETNARLNQLLDEAMSSGCNRRVKAIQKEIRKNYQKEEKQQLKDIRTAEKQIQKEQKKAEKQAQKDLKFQQKQQRLAEREREKAERTITRLATERRGRKGGTAVGNGGYRGENAATPVCTPMDR